MKKANRVVIIGAGLITPQGTAVQEILERTPSLPKFRLSEGNRSEKDIEIGYSKIGDIDSKAYLPGISLHYADGITMYTGIASSMAVKKYITNGSLNPSHIGIALGTALGPAASITSFDLQALAEGPNAVHPMEFPNTVYNAPASNVGIWFKLKAPSITLSNGFTSSMDAIGFAFDEINCGKAQHYLAGGSEEISEDIYRDYVCTAIPKIQVPTGGIIRETIGEGSGMLLLSSMDDAESKGHEIYGEIIDFVSIKLTTGKQYVKSVLDIITTMIGNSGMQESDIMLYSSHLPFNEFACAIHAETERRFEKHQPITQNSLNGISENFLGMSGVFNTVCALEDFKRGNNSKGALVFDIGSDGKFSGILIKKI